ncbi:GL11924 [Drosophila persimilis]|uniref:GL11924 n=1 Tax=Drosophila persimilis TaxID=7234 RepID=B4HCA1_DROPE|nr:GL11924 [Drosophila persimilis]
MAVTGHKSGGDVGYQKATLDRECCQGHSGEQGQRRPKVAPQAPQPKARKPRQKAMSEVSKRHLIVDFIDRSDENGKMTAAQSTRSWSSSSTHEWMAGAEGAPTGSSVGGGQAGDGRQGVDPVYTKGEGALPHCCPRRARQNPDLPRAGWRVLNAGNQLHNEGGLHVIFQISKEAEDLLYLKLGMMAWGIAPAELHIAMEQGHADIALVQKPWIASGNSVAGLKSSKYNLLYSTSVSRNRTAVLVRKGIHAHLMSHNSTVDLTVMLEREEKPLMAASYYMAHDRPATPEELRSLWTEGSKEALKALMETHFPGCTEVTDAKEHQDLATKEQHPQQIFAGIKTPRLDGIFPVITQLTKEVIALWLSAIYSDV